MSEKYCCRIIDEIIETEKSYLNQLEKLEKFFSLPSLEKELLPNHVHSAIFSQISVIYQMNSKLLAEISDKKDDIGHTFLKLAPFLKVYSSYAKNFQKSLSMLQEWESENEPFRSYINATETRPEVQSKLTSLLITPIQRIPRYKLFLEELLKHSDASYFHSNIKEALRLVEDVAQHINQSVDDAHALNRHLSLQKALKNEEPKIFAPGRKFIKEGILNKVSRKGNRSQPRCFFLFSDILMYTKPPHVAGSNSKGNFSHHIDLKPNTLECCCLLPLRHCQVTTLFGSSSQGITFRLQCDDEDLLLYSCSAPDGNDWIRAIKEAIEEATKKRKTLRRDSSRRKVIRKTRQRKFSCNDDNSDLEDAPKNGPKSPCLNLDIFNKSESLKSHLRKMRDCFTPPRKLLSPKRQKECQENRSTPEIVSGSVETITERANQSTTKSLTPSHSHTSGASFPLCKSESKVKTSTSLFSPSWSEKRKLPSDVLSPSRTRTKASKK